MPLTDRVHGETVRRALDPVGVDLDDQNLPDLVIGTEIYAGAAVSEVLRRDPNAEGRDADPAKQHITNALNLLTASYLAPFISQITKDQVANSSQTKATVDWNRRGNELKNRALDEINLAVGTVAVATSMPRVFGVARARRR